MNHFEPSQKMLQDYIQNKLSAVQTERLEVWLADHPQVIQDLELDLMFKQGLAAFENKDKTEQDQFIASSNASLYGRLGSVFMLIIVFLLGGLTTEYFNKKSNNALINPETITLSTSRGTVANVNFSHDKNTVIQIPVAYLSDDHFSVEISNNAQLAHQIQDLIPKDDLLTILIPKRLLNPDLYQLKLTNLNTNEIETYNLDVK
ncbi:MAG: hypothetical protein DWP95_13340 [Proteobacteria bacterium]|nr:MAG: hypothetical protein DWP95_13340 [Pseudomonadota bacterium]